MQEALDKAYLTEKDLTAVAVTIGPGLSLCLRGNAWTQETLKIDLQIVWVSTLIIIFRRINTIAFTRIIKEKLSPMTVIFPMIH